MLVVTLPWLRSWKFAVPIGLNVKDNKGWTVLAHAAHNGHIAVLSLLLKHNADVNVRTNHGCTALMLAAGEGHIECVRRLLAVANIDVNAMDRNGWTPLTYAVENDHAVILSLLIDHKADVNVIADESTALESSCKNGYSDCVQLLLATNGIRVDASDKANNNALMNACMNNHHACVRLLLDAGFDVNAKTDKTQKTALMTATEYGHIDCARLLLDIDNIDVNAMDNNGRTALMFAASNGHTDILQLLIKCKADVNAVRLVISENWACNYKIDCNCSYFCRLDLYPVARHSCRLHSKVIPVASKCYC